MERVFSGVSSVRFGRIGLALVDELRGTGHATSVFVGQIPDRVARIDGIQEGHRQGVVWRSTLPSEEAGCRRDR